MHMRHNTADELQHKLEVVIEEPELLEFYGVRPEECQQVVDAVRASSRVPPNVSIDMARCIVGELEHAELNGDNHSRFIRDFGSLYGVGLRTEVEVKSKTLVGGQRVGDLGHLTFVLTDGGRAEAGFKGNTGDCVTRAFAIASGCPYKEIYQRLAKGNGSQRRSKSDKTKRANTARDGICVKRKWFKDYVRVLGFVWVPTMQIGSGCTTHLRASELPTTGRHVLRMSGHCAAWIDGELHDNHDCSREGSRCIYGYWSLVGR